jgi:undecaprenyl phosphate-alpha-L-ara4FN deformylase
MRIGLRVDVDTLRGTKLGVPNLCRLFADHEINASFFFSVGPDNMGRHLWRLLRPKFLFKMLRTKASRLYGWDILFKGTLWPGPVIGKKLSGVISAAAEAGHEVGLHAWDHHAWQAHIDTMDAEVIRRSLRRGVDMLAKILGRPPTCSAVPGWKCNNLVLMEKSRFPFRYNSDCRGDNIFLPLVDDEQLAQPQIPVTLPTYDEMIGRHGVTESNYNDRLLAECFEDRLNVLTIHAEAEGIACFDMFDRFLKAAEAQGVSFVALGALLDDCPAMGSSRVVQGTISGREGWVSRQETSKSDRKDAG